MKSLTRDIFSIELVVNTLDPYLYSILTVKCIILNSVFVVLENGLFEVSESVHINGHRCMVGDQGHFQV